jgi:hypothetical protein
MSLGEVPSVVATYEVLAPVQAPIAFICEFCGRDLQSGRKLSKHISTVHDEEVLEHVRDTIEFVVNDFMENTDLSDAVSDATDSEVGSRYRVECRC